MLALLVTALLIGAPLAALAAGSWPDIGQARPLAWWSMLGDAAGAAVDGPKVPISV